MGATLAPSPFLRRLIGAAALDPATYEEVEADRTATGQALTAVLMSSVAAGLAAGGIGRMTVPSVAFFSLVALVAWMAWALVTFEVGMRVLPDSDTRVDIGELLRTTGFAATPGLLHVFGLLPGMTTVVFAISAVWMLAAMIVAVRQALDYRNTGRAVAVCVLGWMLALVFALGLGVLFAPSVS
jgi:hypothetical protein